MPALTQCWYTRIHVPHGRRHREEDGWVVSECRYCNRAITSWHKGAWYLADGFNVSKLRDTAGGRYLYVIDTDDEFVVARYPIEVKESPAALRELQEELHRKHGLDKLGCTLQLRDSKDDRAVH